MEEHLQQNGALQNQVRLPLECHSLPGGEIQTTCFKPKRATENHCISYSRFESVPEKGEYFKQYGKELRSKVTDTSMFPHSAIGVVRGTDAVGHTHSGTGVMIGFDLVLTAAHNIIQSNHPLSDLVFIPGVLEGFMPFQFSKVTDIHYPHKQGPNDDYALLILDQNLGERTGFFGIHTAQKETIKEINKKEQPFSLFGYPGYIRNENSEIVLLSTKGDHQQWGMKGNLSIYYDEKDELSVVSYIDNDIFTTPGQSGSGLYYEKDGQFYVVGIHVKGDHEGDPKFNHSIILNKTRYAQIQEWVGISRMKLLQQVVSATKLDLSSKKIDIIGVDFLVKSSHNSPLAKLSLCNCDLGENLKHFMDSQFNELAEFNLSANNLRCVGAQILAGNRTWRKLAILNLDSNSIGDDGAISLSNNHCWVNLESLDLSCNFIGDSGASAIAKNHSWSSLKKLNFQTNKIGNQGARALGKNVSWTKLTSLNISWNLISDQGMIELTENTTWVQLSILRVRNNAFRPSTGITLSINPNWPKVSDFFEYENLAEQLSENIAKSEFNQEGAITSIELDFSSKNLEISGLKILLKFKLHFLTILNLANNPLGERGARIVASNLSWVNMRNMCLSSNHINQAGGVALGNNTCWKTLKELDLCYNNLSDEGAAALSQSNWDQLEVLRVSQNQIGFLGALSLSSKIWAMIMCLHLHGNSIGSDGATALGQNASWVNLLLLDLRNNQIKDQGLMGLSQNSSWKNIEKIFLCGNQITSKGITALCDNKAWSHLKVLRLSQNKITNRGLKMLSQSQWFELEELELGANEIEDQGIKFLSLNKSWRLKTLRLDRNWISRDAKKELKDNLPWKTLEVLSLEHNLTKEDRERIKQMENALYMNAG